MTQAPHHSGTKVKGTFNTYKKMGNPNTHAARAYKKMDILLTPLAPIISVREIAYLPRGARSRSYQFATICQYTGYKQKRETLFLPSVLARWTGILNL